MRAAFFLRHGYEACLGCGAGRGDVAVDVVLLQRVLVDLRVAVYVAADVLLLLGVREDLAHGIDVPADVVLLQWVLVNLWVGVDLPAEVVHDLGVLLYDEELRGHLLGPNLLPLSHK